MNKFHSYIVPATVGLGLGYAVRRGGRRDLIGIGSLGAGAPGVPPGVDSRQWNRTKKGLIVYGILDPAGGLLIDPRGNYVTSQKDLVRWLRNSRIPLYRSEALAAAAKVPVVYGGKRIPTSLCPHHRREGGI